MKTNVTRAAGTAALFLSFATAPAGSESPDHPRNRTHLPTSEIVSGDYLAFGETVEISGTVNGDLYAAAGEVLINGTVNGDVLVAGGRVNVAGTVSQDVRAAGGRVAIAGTIGRNLTVAGGSVELAPSAAIQGGLVAAAGSVELSAPVEETAKVTGGNLILSSRLGSDLEAAVGKLTLTSRADIRGGVNYWSRREAAVHEGARIGGEIVRNVPPRKPRLLPAATFAWLLWLSASFVSTMILGLLSTRFLPKFHQGAVDAVGEKPWASLGVGLAAAAAVPIVCALLSMTVVGIPLALILLAAFLVLLYWSRIYMIAWIGEAVLGRFRPNPGRTSAFILGMMVYYLMAMIPFVTWLVVPLVVLFGLGAELIARKNFYRSARRQDLI